MKKLPFRKVLALSPHTDDIEFACGATLHRLMREGAVIHSAVFSLCEESVPQGLPKDILLREMQAAAKKLNIPQKNLHVYRFPVRKFPGHRQEILEDLVKLNRLLAPDLVLTPASTDVHQDHQVIHAESKRAFREQTILGFELPWNNTAFPAQALIRVSPENLAAKAAAIACYESQKFRQYSRSEWWEGMAKIRGFLNKSDLAEAFEVIRLSL